jgi:hypothetical protein
MRDDRVFGAIALRAQRRHAALSEFQGHEIPMRLIAPLAALVVLAAAPALAQQPRQERDDASLKQYCTVDYFKFCGNIPPDGPEVDRCFARNWSALSPNCRTAIDAYDAASKPKGKTKS